MAKGQTAAKIVVVNNVKAVTVTKTVELIVKNDMLVPDTNETEPGVNSNTNKN